MGDIRKVKDGKVAVSDLPDGATVIVQSVEDTRPFTVTAEQQAELLESIRQANDGETVDAFEHLAKLRSQSIDGN